MNVSDDLLIAWRSFGFLAVAKDAKFKFLKR